MEMSTRYTGVDMCLCVVPEKHIRHEASGTWGGKGRKASPRWFKLAAEEGGAKVKYSRSLVSRR